MKSVAEVVGVSRSNLIERMRERCPDAHTVMHQLSAWITHYNEVHPHKALGYRSPREFIAALGSS